MLTENEILWLMQDLAEVAITFGAHPSIRERASQMAIERVGIACRKKAYENITKAPWYDDGW